MSVDDWSMEAVVAVSLLLQKQVAQVLLRAVMQRERSELRALKYDLYCKE